MPGRTRRILESNGEKEARAYAVMVVPPPIAVPAVELERVRIVDPRETSTVVSGAPPVGSGPRNPEQRTAEPGPPRVDLPDALPATKAQRVLIDPELVAQWRAEASHKGTA